MQINFYQQLITIYGKQCTRVFHRNEQCDQRYGVSPVAFKLNQYTRVVRAAPRSVENSLQYTVQSLSGMPDEKGVRRERRPRGWVPRGARVKFSTLARQ